MIAAFLLFFMFEQPEFVLVQTFIRPDLVTDNEEVAEKHVTIRPFMTLKKCQDFVIDNGWVEMRIYGDKNKYYYKCFKIDYD